MKFEPRGYIFRHKLSDGFYEDNFALISEINSKMYKDYQKYEESKKIKPIKLFYDNFSHKTVLKIFEDAQQVTFNKVLANLLGMKTRYVGAGRNVSSKVLDVHENQSTSMYVYCDLIRHRAVGNVLAPLLRVVPLTYPSKQRNHIIYDQPHYIPLQRKQFDNIEILLSTDKGESNVFSQGDTVITLHIRPRKQL